MSRTVKIDFGLPFTVPAPGGEGGVLMAANVCGSPECPGRTLHLTAFPVSSDGGRDALDRTTRVWLDWHVDTRQLEAEASDLARLPGGEALAAWCEEHAETLAQRFERLRLQVDSSCFDRPAPPWEPGTRIAYVELFPEAFVPSVVFERTLWGIIDSHCPDPACPCITTTLALVGPNDDEELVEADLDAIRPEQATRRGRALWRAIRSDPRLLDRLRRRRREVRDAGAFIVASAYEAKRRTQPTRVASAPTEAYLLGGTLSPEVIEHLFEVARKLCATNAWWALAPDCLAHIEVSGAVRAERWLELDGPTTSLAIGDVPGGEDDRPLILGVDDRLLVPWQHRLE